MLSLADEGCNSNLLELWQKVLSQNAARRYFSPSVLDMVLLESLVSERIQSGSSSKSSYPAGRVVEDTRFTFNRTRGQSVVASSNARQLLASHIIVELATRSTFVAPLCS